MGRPLCRRARRLSKGEVLPCLLPAVEGRLFCVCIAACLDGCRPACTLQGCSCCCSVPLGSAVVTMQQPLTEASGSKSAASEDSCAVQCVPLSLAPAFVAAAPAEGASVAALELLHCAGSKGWLPATLEAPADWTDSGSVLHLAGGSKPSESAQPACDSSAAALAGFLGRKVSELGSGGRALLGGRASSAFLTAACLLTGKTVLAVTTG